MRRIVFGAIAAMLVGATVPVAAQDTPATAPPPVNADTFDTSKPVIGIGFAATPAGLIVREVLANSGAERAGIVAGMVITHVNGILVKNMSLDTAGAILGAAPDELTFTVAGRGDIVVHKLAIAPATAPATE